MAIEASGVKIRRLAHPTRALAFLLTTLLVALAAFFLGTFVRSPDANVLDARYESIPVYASITERVVDDSVRIQGETVGNQVQPVFAQVPEGASVAVTTTNALTAGAELQNGDLLGTISDRPIFVLVLSIPLFRDLYRDDEGSDVTSLQQALNVRATGKVNSETLRGLARLYERHKITAPIANNEVFLKMSEFYALTPVENLRLGSITPVGTRLSDETPFAEITSGLPYIVIRAGVAEAEEFALGGPVSILRSDGSLVDGQVSEIGPFDSSPTDAGRPPGRDITVTVGNQVELAAGEAVTITTGDTVEPLMAVPTTAIRSDPDGTYVLRQGTEKVTERVAVTPLATGQGWTSISSDDARIGDNILVSG